MCLLRKGPENLPSSSFATMIVFAIYLAIATTVVTLTRPEETVFVVLGTIAIGISIQALITYLLLAFKGYRQRFPRTWAGLLGTNAVMLLILLPFNFILLQSESDALRLFADSATWVCLGWWLAIAGFIYHRSVGISVLQGSVLAFLIELLGVYTAYGLFQS